MLNFDKKFKDFSDKNIIVGKLNLNKNELDEDIEKKPTLRIYKFNKNNKKIFDLDNNFNKYTEFLNKHLNLNLIDDYEKEEL